MSPAPGAFLRRNAWPVAAFVAVFTAHFIYSGLYAEQAPAQAGWASVGPAPTWLQSYARSGAFWLGYSYALPIGFALAAFRHYRCTAARCSAKLAMGGLTLSGVLSVGGCFLVGCCGSPMLVVWLDLFGAAALPLAKPLLAGITTVSIVAAGWWMRRARRRNAAACDCP